MAHGITQIDVIDSIAQEWHGLAKVRAQSELNTFEGSALDWQVERFPLSFPNGQFACHGIGTLTKGGIAFLCNGEETYQPIQNRELFDTFRILIDEFGFNVECCGSVYGRKRVFYTLSNGDALKSDNVNVKLNITNSHDKSTKTQFFTSMVRIVCANTWRMAMQSKTSDFEAFLKKTRNVQDRVAVVKAGLVKFAVAQTQADEKIEGMKAHAIDKERATELATAFFNPKGTRGENQVKEIVGLFENGAGNEGKSVYDLFNGITQYFTHGAIESKKEKADTWLSSEFGSYGNIKEKAWGVFSNADAIANL